MLTPETICVRKQPKIMFRDFETVYVLERINPHRPPEE